MNRHVVLHAMFLSILFMVCLGAGGSAAAQGTPRPSYPSGFAPGTRVFLLADAPVVGDGLLAGMAGTVICCDAGDCTGSILVSWDLWTGGTDEGDRCVTGPVKPYPAGSATWVDPRAVLLGQPFDKTGVLSEDEEGCLYLETQDGKSFYLAIGPEFRRQWWMVLPGNSLRIRGLINTNGPAPDVTRDCPQRDGDIYHPIMTPSDWTGESCCDRWVCSFLYGDSVVLIGEDNPNGATDLPRGTSGTIICCDSRSQNSVLVSWNLWSNGGPDDVYATCNERLVGIFPPASTWWVPVEDLAKYVKTGCGSLQEIRLCTDGQCQDVPAAGLFVPSDGLYYLPDLTPQTPLPGEQFIASGLYAPYATLPDGLAVTSAPGVQAALAKVILHSVLLPCPTLGCCKPAYVAGDRVVLLVDEPGGAAGLFANAAGTVICCNSTDPEAPILVCWDFWTGGHNEVEKCDCCEDSSSWYPETSCWWMACSEIERIVLADLYDAGEEFRGFAPSSFVAGKPGQGLTITGTIGNRGDRSADTFFMDIYASTDREITQTDYRLGGVGMGIGPGSRMAFSYIGQFPTTIPAGTYYVGWLIDRNNLIEEADEDNNTAVIEAGQLIVTSE